MSMIQCTQCNAQIHESAVTCPSCGAPTTPKDVSSNNPFYWLKVVLNKYATFSGRARRKEYWMSFLAYTIINIVLNIIEGVLFHTNFCSSIFILALFIPSLSVAVRRMHDIDRSGWWILVPIILIIFACTEGTRGANRFGKDPKQEN